MVDGVSAAAADLSQLSIDEQSNAHSSRSILARTVRKRHHARDITDEFTNACHSLKVGELVKDENFSLWNSVQALEVMDHKMDTGYVAPDESFDTGFDVRQPILPEEVLYIIDRIFCLEMTWLRGSALFQTLLTSEHIFHLVKPDGHTAGGPYFPVRPDGTDKQRDPRWVTMCLLAYCVSTVIQIDMTIELVASQQYFEEEDLNTATYQLKLLSDTSDEQAVQLLDDAIQWLTTGTGDMTPVEEAILDRLELRKASLIRYILSPDTYDSSTLLQVMSTLEENSKLGKPIPAAFNAKQYRKLSTLTPVRHAAEISLQDAVADFTSICECLNQQHYFLGAQQVYRSAACLHRLLWMFALRHPRPSVLARATLQYQLLGNGAPLDRPEGFYEYMLSELEALGFPDETLTNGSLLLDDIPPKSPWEPIRDAVNAWVQRSKTIFLPVLRALCMNHCRMRRCLINTLPSFKPIAPPPPTQAPHDGAQYLEATLENAIQLRRWQVSAWITQLGMDHDIYQPYELASQYANLHSHLRAQLDILQAQLARLNAAASDPTALPPPFRTTKRALAAATAHLTAHIADTRAPALLANAFRLVYAVLMRAHLLPGPPSTSLTTPALVHELRSRAHAVTRSETALPPFADFDAAALERTTPHAELPQLLDAADSALREVRVIVTEAARASDEQTLRALGRDRALDAAWSEGARRMLRASIELKLCVATLKGALAAGVVQNGQRRVAVVVPPPAKRSHPWWIVPEVTVSARA